ncbi:glycosyltransferase [Prosthecobacter sp.]|uniref:glycosyltransferase n=1 Tax=Prosthecobacter sp. TaxID=1965333 RepID=UPI001DCC474D|nr:glycosyltransferase [Prosthecobacter sp.]MCB1278784.1 glycosyltransferase [Prosthecobacter sp.]
MSTIQPTNGTVENADTRPTVLHYLYNLGGGGAEAMLMNLIESLDRTQFRMVVVAVHAAPWPDHVRRLIEAGAVLHELGSVSLAKLRHVLRAERPEIVQTWMQQADFVGGWMARLAGIRRIIWSIHSLEIFCDQQCGPFKNALYRATFALSSRVIPVRIVSCSAAAIDVHAATGYPRHKMQRIPNGIDADRFVPDCEIARNTRQRLNLPVDAPVIGYVGRFHEAKDFPTLLRAAKIMQAREPRTHFLLCGGLESELSPEERRLLGQLPAPDQVRFESFRDDIWTIHPALDVFTLSSRTEAAPLSILEAMACGVPCVVTDVGDCASLLGGMGRVVPARSPDSLAKAWEDTLNFTPEERVETGRRSRARVLDQFTIARSAGQYARLYDGLLSM